MSSPGVQKAFMIVNRRAPHGTIYALESLEVALIATAFGQKVSLAFIDDGVYQLCKKQNTSGIGLKNFSQTFLALGDFDIKDVYVEKESLAARGLKVSDLLRLVHEDEDDNWVEKKSIHLVSSQELAAVFVAQEIVLNF